MERALKNHVQQPITFPDRNGQWRGVRPRKIRKRLGRPPKGERAGERHDRREEIKLGTPVHVVLRVAGAVGRLRGHKTYSALRGALLVSAGREGFHVVHVSIQAKHVHMIVEATDRMTLARGMQSFQISAAKRLNAAIRQPGKERRRGCVFTDRYHAQLITNPKQARHCLAYVLNNWRHHHEDRAGLERSWKIDRFSSAIRFDGWLEPWAAPGAWERPGPWLTSRGQVAEPYLELPVWPPESWVLRVGWRRFGLIVTTEVPGPRAFADR